MISTPYKDLEQEYRDILLYDEQHRILAQLGLVILVYFHEGGPVAGQRKVLEVFDRFYMQYHAYLKSHFWHGMRRFAKLNQSAFFKKQQKVLAEAEQGEALFGLLSSDESGDFSPEYAISTWDNANFEQGIFNPESKKAELMPVYGQKPYEVPYSGMWVPDNVSEGIEQHLEKGEVFPNDGEYIRTLPDGTRKVSKELYVVCRLVKRDDDESVLLPSEF